MEGAESRRLWRGRWHSRYFNAPIAGVFFALEVILGEYSVASVGTVVTASVIASAIGRTVFGYVPAFVVPPYALHSLWELPLYGALGAVAAIAAFIHAHSIYIAEDGFDGIRRVSVWLKRAIGGAAIGVLALAYGLLPGLSFDTVPHVFGTGYATIDRLFPDGYGVHLMLVLLVLKVLCTAITLGSGGSGGVFAPSLFVGAAVGGIFASIVRHLWPGIVVDGGGYVLVRMAAVFAGASHAPITSVITLFELTGDYRIILPLMLAVVVSTALSHRLMGRQSIYTLKLARRGVEVASGRQPDVLDRVRVEEVATTDILALRPHHTLADLKTVL